MDKYTSDQLVQMARQALALNPIEDPRAIRFQAAMCARTGLMPSAMWAKVQKNADSRHSLDNMSEFEEEFGHFIRPAA